jgi:hypothetical protein
MPLLMARKVCGSDMSTFGRQWLSGQRWGTGLRPYIRMISARSPPMKLMRSWKKVYIVNACFYLSTAKHKNAVALYLIHISERIYPKRGFDRY